MKRSLFAVMLATLIGSESISATPDNDQKNGLSQRTAAFAAHGLCSIGFGLATVFFGKLAHQFGNTEARYDFTKFRDTHKAYNFALNEEKALTSAHDIMRTSVDALSRNRSYFESDTSYDNFIKQLKHCRDDIACQANRASWNTRHLNLNRTDAIIKLSGPSARVAALGFVAAGCAYGTYWFGKNAHNRVRSLKE